MRRAPSKPFRWALAVLLGIPGTVVFLPLAALVAYAGALSLFGAMREGGLSYALLPEVLLGTRNAVWGTAGVLGLFGFWLWVVQPRFINRPFGRALVSCFVAAGVIAMAPIAVVLSTNPAQTSHWLVLSVLGIAAGVFVLYHQWFSCGCGPTIELGS